MGQDPACMVACLWEVWRLLGPVAIGGNSKYNSQTARATSQKVGS